MQARMIKEDRGRAVLDVLEIVDFLDQVFVTVHEDCGALPDYLIRYITEVILFHLTELFLQKADFLFRWWDGRVQGYKRIKIIQLLMKDRCTGWGCLCGVLRTGLQEAFFDERDISKRLMLFRCNLVGNTHT